MGSGRVTARASIDSFDARTGRLVAGGGGTPVRKRSERQAAEHPFDDGPQAVADLTADLEDLLMG